MFKTPLNCWEPHISLTLYHNAKYDVKIQLIIEPVAIDTRSLRRKSTQSLDMDHFHRDVSMNGTTSPL